MDDSDDEYISRINAHALKQLAAIKERLFKINKVRPNEPCLSSQAKKSASDIVETKPQSRGNRSFIPQVATSTSPTEHEKNRQVQEPTSGIIYRQIVNEKIVEGAENRNSTSACVIDRTSSKVHQKPQSYPNVQPPADSVERGRVVENRERPRSNAPIPVIHRRVTESVTRAIHRPTENQRVVVSPVRLTGNCLNEEMNNQTNQSECSLLVDNDGFPLDQRRRYDPIIPLFEPIVQSDPLSGQSTWIDETNRTLVTSPARNSHLSANAAIIAPPDDQAYDISPTSTEFPEMFSEFRRDLAEQDRRKEEQSRLVERERHFSEELLSVSQDQQSSSTSQFDAYEYPSRPTTAMSRRAPILPPLSKGKKSKQDKAMHVADVRSITEVRNQPPQQPQSSLLNFGLAGSSEIPVLTGSRIATQTHNPELGSSDSSDVGMKKEHNLATLTSEMLEGMSEKELKQITDEFYDSLPRLKFKESYPYMAEGIVQKDGETDLLKVFSTRIGKVLIPDHRLKKSEDYACFIVIKPGHYGGFTYWTHPPCLVSAKFPSADRLVLRGYAILAHPSGSRDDSLKENRWICWNDSLGLMNVISGAARTPLKKQPVWDKQLDVISIHANFENKKFVVTKVVGLTNSVEKNDHFPEEVFLVKDAVYRKTTEGDTVFFSLSINAEIFIKNTLVGEGNLNWNNPFEIVVVPSFLNSTTREFRAILIIRTPTMFWSKDKEWIRQKLVDREKAYH